MARRGERRGGERAMINRRQFTLGLAAATLAVPARGWAAGTLAETPFFKDEVASGALPPIGDRIPQDPALAELETIGRPGGDLRMLMSSPKDTRLMVVYGYARLVASTPALALTPDILNAVDVQDNRVFTLHLRAGHKWSDGHPFTSEDFRYWFDDMANNADLMPSGLPLALLPNGDKPQFEVVDPATVRYTWPRPNPLFLPALAGAYPLYIYAPAHYLKQFHVKYADKATLAALVKKFSARNWAALHTKLDNEYRNDNPNLPSLQPWILKTKPPADRIVFERTASSSSATPITTGSTARGISSPISTASSCRLPTARSSRRRQGPAKAICRRAICALTTTRS
jgi:peptide/nickel transport system substrate-binding protein